MSRSLAAGRAAHLACLWEASAHKPGNVHPEASFSDVCYDDYVASAAAIAPAMEQAASQPLGSTILAAVEATQRAVGRNTNLGTILLLAPLASVPASGPLRSGVATALGRLTTTDAAQIYEAIQRARPGGMGSTAKMDVQGPPPDDLLSAMRAAADRDMIARQYAENFDPLFEEIIPRLRTAHHEEAMPLETAIVHVHLQVMHTFPDSLIARKCGVQVAEEAAERAGAVLSAGPTGSEAYRTALAELDRYLRGDGHRRNPGTTADLLAAALFSLLRDGIITESEPPGGRLVRQTIPSTENADA